MYKEAVRKKPIYFLPIAFAVLITGIYTSYHLTGLSLSLIPDIISYLGIACLLSELATGNIALVDLRNWDKIEIGYYGKLALLLMAVSLVVGNFINS